MNKDTLPLKKRDLSCRTLSGRLLKIIADTLHTLYLLPASKTTTREG
jgi:hypothetical protein